MSISIFDLFSIGIGPSSSHTVGPMRAAKSFSQLIENKQFFKNANHILVQLYGSLALTGKGHGTDIAILNGLCGQDPETLDPIQAKVLAHDITKNKTLNLLNQKIISFDPKTDLLFLQKETLPLHSNGMIFRAYENETLLLEETYYSIGGGFITTEKEFGTDHSSSVQIPYPFKTAAELMAVCKKNNLSIPELMMANESKMRSEQQVRERLLKIAKIMGECIERGCHSKEALLPGGLQVRRRAPQLYQKLKAQTEGDTMNWLNVFAIAVNEENAAGGRVVTAPTNGAAGIVPAVLEYYKRFVKDANEQGIIDYLLTAGAIAILYKINASISGAEVGCQGEVGTASSMAAGAITAVMNGTIEQIENAAEIAMEHHLGMTCDPMMGLVQIPCIERNAMGAIKAVNASRLSLMEDGEHKVSLDKVIATMFQTGKDMMTIYKETSQGGLAVNMPEC